MGDLRSARDLLRVRSGAVLRVVSDGRDSTAVYRAGRAAAVPDLGLPGHAAPIHGLRGVAAREHDHPVAEGRGHRRRLDPTGPAGLLVLAALSAPESGEPCLAVRRAAAGPSDSRACWSRGP